MNLPAAFLILLSLFEVPPTKEAAANSVANGSLTGLVAENGLPDGWSSFPAGFPHHVCHVASPGRADDFAVRLDCQSQWASVITNIVPIPAGSRQAAQIALKRVGGEGAVVFYLNYYNAGGIECGKPRRLEFDASELPLGQWRNLHVEQPAESDAVGCALTVSVSNTVRLMADDFDLRLFADPHGTGDNLLLNGNGETANGDRPWRWEAWKFMPQDVELKWSEREPHSGWGCVEVRGRAERVFVLVGRTDIDPTRTYRLEGWTRLREGKGRFRIVLLDEKSKEFRTHDLPEESGAAWTRSGKVLGPSDLSGATHALIGFECNGAFEASVDDVAFFEVAK